MIKDVDYLETTDYKLNCYCSYLGLLVAAVGPLLSVLGRLLLLKSGRIRETTSLIGFEFTLGPGILLFKNMDSVAIVGGD